MNCIPEGRYAVVESRWEVVDVVFAPSPHDRTAKVVAVVESVVVEEPHSGDVHAAGDVVEAVVAQVGGVIGEGLRSALLTWLGEEVEVVRGDFFMWRFFFVEWDFMPQCEGCSK